MPLPSIVPHLDALDSHINFQKAQGNGSISYYATYLPKKFEIMSEPQEVGCY